MTLNRKTVLQPAILEDSLAVRDQLPRLVQLQVRQLIDTAQSTSQKIDWTSLRVDLKRVSPFGGLMLHSTVDLAE